MSDADQITVLPFASPQQPWVSAEPRQATIPQRIPSAEPVYSYGLLVAKGKVKGHLSEYRDGQLTLTREAIFLEGQAVVPRKTRLWILIPLYLSGLLLGLIVSIALEHAARSHRSDRLSWHDVEEIVLEPQKERVCLVYKKPADPKTFYSLTFKPGFYWGSFVDAARYFAAEKVREGKIGPAISPFAWLAVFLLFALPIGFIVYLAQQ